MALINRVTFVLTVVVVLVGVYVGIFPRRCHDVDCSIYSHLGTKAPYRTVANLNAEPLSYKGCKPVKLWHIVRHGTRLPNKHVIKRVKEHLSQLKPLIVENIKNGKGKLCSSLKQSFQDWEFKADGGREKFLTDEGEDEMLLLGERMRLRFPSVFKEPYSNEIYKFRYTASQRTMMSTILYASGVFGKKVAESIPYPEPLERDPILRFYKLCEKWRKTIAKNNSTFEEQNKFGVSEEMNKTVKSISERVGLDTLTTDVVFLMYEACRFEVAWDSTAESPWCSVFTPSDVKVLEYYDELKYYYRDGYGYSLNYEQSCPAFNDMIKFFRSASPNPKGVFYFTHSGTLLKLLAFLNLYKDEKILLSSNYEEQSERQFRVSHIDAFGTNLAFVLYRCEGETDQVLILHQEKPKRIPGCPTDHDLCPLSTLIDIYKSSINDCKFNEMCKLNE